MEFQEPFLGTRQVAEKLTVARGQVLDWIHSGPLEAINVSR